MRPTSPIVEIIVLKIHGYELYILSWLDLFTLEHVILIYWNIIEKDVKIVICQ